MLTVACVWVGDKYQVTYVEKLYNMVKRHLPIPYEFCVYTDQPEKIKLKASIIITPPELTGWWAKMTLFRTRFRADYPTLYFDLDTAIINDITALALIAETTHGLGISKNFTRLAGHKTWPCAYGSCVMTLAPGWGNDIWETFWASRDAVIAANPRGDQQAIEQLVPKDQVTLLQDDLPDGFLISYRAINDHQDSPPKGASVVCFGGRRRPHNTSATWIREAWQ